MTHSTPLLLLVMEPSRRKLKSEIRLIFNPGFWLIFSWSNSGNREDWRLPQVTNLHYLVHAFLPLLFDLLCAFLQVVALFETHGHFSLTILQIHVCLVVFLTQSILWVATGKCKPYCGVQPVSKNGRPLLLQVRPFCVKFLFNHAICSNLGIFGH